MSDEIDLKILIYGCGFPYFSSTVTLLRWRESIILIDTGSIIAREELVKKLNQLGIAISDVGHIVFTHMHMDHYGNLDLFPNAKLYMTYPEFEFFNILNRNKEQFGRDYIIRIWKSTENWKPFAESPLLLDNQGPLYESIKSLSDSQMKGLTFIADGQVLFEKLRIFRCFGHSVDHIGVQIQEKDSSKTVLVTGDVLANRRRLERLRTNSATANVGQMYDELNLKVFQKLGSVIIPGHDRPFNLETGAYVNGITYVN